jgi:hypothetical protein
MVARRLTEKFTDAQFAPLLEPEAEAARRLYADGILRAIYGRHDAPGAILQLEAASADEARAIVLERLPLAKAGMLELTFFPCGPYRGFLPRT